MSSLRKQGTREGRNRKERRPTITTRKNRQPSTILQQKDDLIPAAFGHHAADGSVDVKALTNVSLQFRMLRLQHAMTAGDILAAANHLASHFDDLGLTVPPTVQALRTARNGSRGTLPAPLRPSRRSPSGARK